MAEQKAHWTVCLLGLFGHIAPTAESLKAGSVSSVANALESLANSSDFVGRSTWAQYTFENSLSDVSGNGRNFVSGSSWSPVYTAGVSGQAVYLNSASSTYADSSNSWLKGPVINSADASGQYFEISFDLAFVSSGHSGSEYILNFAAPNHNYVDTPLLYKAPGGVVIWANSAVAFHGNVAPIWNSAWHSVKFSTSDPCNPSTWTIVIDGTTQTSNFGSICDKELHFNRYCWDNGASCSSRVNMMLDNMVITAGAPTTTAATTTAPPTPGGSGSAVGDPHLVNMHGERFDIMRAGRYKLLHIPRDADMHTVLLAASADVFRYGHSCTDMYFTAINITGQWSVGHKNTTFVAGAAPPKTSTGWVHFGNVALKVVHGKTNKATPYLNFFARNVQHSGHSVGGLLGDEDHTNAETPDTGCQNRMALLQTHDV